MMTMSRRSSFPHDVRGQLTFFREGEGCASGGVETEDAQVTQLTIRFLFLRFPTDGEGLKDQWGEKDRKTKNEKKKYIPTLCTAEHLPRRHECGVQNYRTHMYRYTRSAIFRYLSISARDNRNGEGRGSTNYRQRETVSFLFPRDATIRESPRYRLPVVGAHRRRHCQLGQKRIT